jgi:hypothetical protein
VILLEPADDEDEMDLTPSIPFIDFSRGSVICDSIISEFAPVYEVDTVIIGGSIAGYKRTPKKDNPTTPSRMIKRLNTIEPTGRFKAISEMSIGPYFLIFE